MRISIGSDDFKDAIVQLKNRNVERAAAEIVKGNNPVLLFGESVGKRRSRRLVDQPKNIKPSDAPCIFGGLPLRVVEIRRHRNNGFRDWAAKEALSIAFQLAQDQRRNFGR